MTGKRVLLAAAAAVTVAMLLVVGPALSARPYTPKPVQFEIAAPGGERSAGAGGEIVSAPVLAPKRFNMVGLTWSGSTEPAIAVRVRAEGEVWGPWTTAATGEGGGDPGAGESPPGGASEPVWAGQSDFVQYRISRRPPDLRLSFLNTTGSATAVDRFETALRGAASRAATTLAGIAPAVAGVPRPGLVPREDWGGEACQPRRPPDRGDVKLAFVHHTATANDYSAAEAPAVVLGICLYHRDSRGWDDIGYNFLVDRFGTTYEGRAGGVEEALVGAHAQGFNSQSTGIATLGSHESDSARRASLHAMARLIRWKLPLHGASTQGRLKVVSGGGDLNRWPEGEEVKLSRVSAHRKVEATSCPGDALVRQLDRLRRLSDVDPPERPRRVVAEADGRKILIDWAKSGAPDLDGYEVHRLGASGEWRKIAESSRSEFLHRDRRRGKRYTYRVTAYDRREPANVSEPSAAASATVGLDG